jgi:hypothetical protein
VLRVPIRDEVAASAKGHRRFLDPFEVPAEDVHLDPDSGNAVLVPTFP